MCGIISLFNQETTYQISVTKAMMELVSTNTVRGHDSTGLAFGGWYEADTYKRAVPGYDFVESRQVGRILSGWNDGQFIIGHNRAATKGLITTGNAHPFTIKHITGVHNGTVNNYAGLVTAIYGTDSETIIAAIAEHGAAAVIPKLDGAYVLMWHDTEDNTMHFIRNEERPYTFAKIKDKNMIFGASEYRMMDWILSRNNLEVQESFFPKPMIEYIFELDGNLMTPLEVEHEEYYPPVYVPPKQNWTKPAHGPGKGGSNIVDIIDAKRTDRTVHFYVSAYSKYPENTGLGSWRGTSDSQNEVHVYNSLECDLETGVWYTGITKTQGEGTLAVDIESVSEYEKMHQPYVDETEDECTECKKTLPCSDLVYYSTKPVCVDCLDTFERKQKEDK